MSLKNINISKKLPLFILGLVVLTSFISSFVMEHSASRALTGAVEKKMVALAASRASALDIYLTSVAEDLSSLAMSDYATQALYDFKAGWDTMKVQGDPEAKLQELYIEANPNPTGSKEELDFAKDGSLYSAMHKKHHPWFRHFLRQKDFYDIFLVAPNGDLVYSVFKELDYATNLNNGEYKDSDLGNAFRAALKAPKDGKQHFFDFQPYAPSHGAPASFISQAIMDGKGGVAGVLVFQMPISRINEVMQVSAGMGKTGETYLVGADHLMRSDSRFSEESTILKREIKGGRIEAALAGETGFAHVKNQDGIYVLSAYAPIAFNGVNWAVLAEINEDEVQEPIKDMIIEAAMLAVAILIVFMILSLLFARSISKPISAMVEAMRELAKDNFDVSIPGVDRKDEIGEMASSVQIFKENGIEAKRLQKEQALVKERSDEEKKRLMLEMADQFDEQVGAAIRSLTSAAQELQKASGNIDNTAMQTQESSNSVAAAAEETSANVSTVASATEEMTASAQEISTQISDVAAKANTASTSASNTSSKVDQLDSLVGNIGEVVAAIRDIAEQTNLLALNATIEAARAGEAGKGFAVVAEEVKKLATETGQKTDEIEARITEIQNATRDSVEAMQLIINNISEIDAASTNTAGAVEEQNAVIHEITRNISEVSEATRDVANIIGQVQAAAGESGEASQVLKITSDNISQLSSTLDRAVSEFLRNIRDDVQKETVAEEDAVSGDTELSEDVGVSEADNIVRIEPASEGGSESEPPVKEA